MLAVLFMLAAQVPRAALLDDPVSAAAAARAERKSEPFRGVAEYVAGLGAFTAVNGLGSMLLSGSRVTVARGGRVSLNGSEASFAGAGACFVLSPLALALTTWLIGKGSDAWDPSFGWATFGAYGSSLLAIGAGAGLAAANVDRDAAIGANAALYLAVPLATVLIQNATKSPAP